MSSINGGIKTKDCFDLFGFDAEDHKDRRNIHHKGKHSYNSKDQTRVHYIKQRKDMQRGEQKCRDYPKIEEGGCFISY
jgi:hypothetical protein